MLSSIHSQNTPSEIRVFIFFEDEIFNREYLGKANLKSLKERLSVIMPFLVSDLPPRKPLIFNLEQFKEFTRFLDSKVNDLRREKNAALQRFCYIKICLKKIARKIQDLFSEHENCTVSFEINTITSITDQSKHSKYRLAPIDSNFDKLNHFQLAFWCLDCDGLEVSPRILNLGRYTSVTPLQPFVNVRNKTQMKMKPNEQYLHHPQTIRSKNDFSSLVCVMKNLVVIC